MVRSVRQKMERYPPLIADYETFMPLGVTDIFLTEYRQWTHVFKILREIDLLYEYYGHFHHVIDKTKNIGGTVPVC